MEGEVLRDLSVLVCDDSELVRTQLKETLTTIGVEEIIEAKDGEEAVAVCLEKQPDLVFMDIIMPKKDGIAALKEINQQDPMIKVIMASSSSGQSHLRNSLLLGAYKFIQKPISEIVIRDILYNFLDEHPARKSKV
ncbi:two-component system response regulator [Salipaludibacillus keqinensis]|jgi:two-component system, chemotaxis family, chemotaxis protein CheY|uniref:Two-component system response regulator n=1 Tax=Salipaludibacillus keqinensis TaxID=2045207 RepID=A0A323TWS3_9BACI|nr:two-component system response regulator [Salipaludibacillus keqinensis]